MDFKIDGDFTRMRAVPLSVSKGKSESQAPISSKDEGEPPSILRSQRMLLDKLNDLPEIRPEKIAYGKKLAQSEAYPTAQDLEKLAFKLLGNLENSIEEN